MKATLLGGLLGLVAAGASGCSFVFVRGPPDRPIAPDAALKCSDSLAAPITDLILGSVTMVLTAVGKKQDEQNQTGPQLVMDPYPYLIGIGLLWLGSSVFGFVQSDRCQEVMEAQRSCAKGLAMACRYLKEESPPPPRRVSE